jgi:outer membrane protein
MAKFLTRVLFLPLLVTLLTAPFVAAQAEDEPKNIVALGYYFVFYNVHATDLSGPFTPPGLGLDLQDTQTPYFAYIRNLSTHFSIELAVGVPPLTKSVGKGPPALGSVPYDGVVLSTARWFAPSLLVRYKLFDDTHIFRPYIGVGLNYVYFYDRRATPEGEAVAGGPTRIELPASLGIAGTAGVSVKLPDHFGLALSFSASRVESHLSTITGDIVRTSDISFNPSAIVLAATYAF